MREVETMLSNLYAKNKVFNALEKSFELLNEDNTEEAKKVIAFAIELNKDSYYKSNILYRILAMVYKLCKSNYKFNDIIRYHKEYRSIMDISGFGNNWVYGDDVYEIKEVSELVVSLGEYMLPEDYNKLLTYVSKFDTNSMNFIHKEIDHSLVEPVSKMMMVLEHINVYNIDMLLLDNHTPKDIFNACEKLDDSE